MRRRIQAPLFEAEIRSMPVERHHARYQEGCRSMPGQCGDGDGSGEGSIEHQLHCTFLLSKRVISCRNRAVKRSNIIARCKLSICAKLERRKERKSWMRNRRIISSRARKFRVAFLLRKSLESSFYRTPSVSKYAKAEIELGDHFLFLRLNSPNRGLAVSIRARESERVDWRTAAIRTTQRKDDWTRSRVRQKELFNAGRWRTSSNLGDSATSSTPQRSRPNYPRSPRAPLPSVLSRLLLPPTPRMAYPRIRDSAPSRRSSSRGVAY